jgi:acetolactate synthase-1/2/3 large subunit
MTTAPSPATAADVLVRRLRDHGVRHVFGYPGGQLTPLYDALARQTDIRHVLTRHEQAAGFMADGYARATGKPGVCLAVCGPGVLNAATPLATAFTDSVPVLLVSGQVPSSARGLRSGYYHENDQLSACATLTKWQTGVAAGADVVALVDEAFRRLTEGRPGPVLLEVPVDVLRSPGVADPWPPLPVPEPPPAPSPEEAEALARLASGWRRPLILAGGGVVSAGAEGLLAEVAERLGSPVFHTAMGKCALPSSHPLAAGLPWHEATSDLSNMAPFFSPLFAEADGLLAVGCRFTQLTTGGWVLPLPPSRAQIDIDPEEIGRHYPVSVGACADAAETLRALLHALPGERRPPWAGRPAARKPWALPGPDLVGPLRRALPPEAVVVADITRLGYVLLVRFPVERPRTFLHPAGYVAMGYGIPAALGAKAALPDRPVVAVLGDGCFQMCGMELATAVQEGLPVVIVLVNDGSLTLIKAIQQRRYEGRFLGVDLRNPDFGTFARAFGVRHVLPRSAEEFEAAVREGVGSGETVVVEVRPGDAHG